MEKYGVREDTADSKVAETKAGGKCPSCGASIKDPAETGVLVCPNCGTQPFEKK